MKAKVTFTVDAPTPCTEDELIEWVLFNIGYSGSMACYPLGDISLNAKEPKIIIVNEQTPELQTK